MAETRTPVLLAVGRVMITGACEKAFQEAQEQPGAYLARHVCGDWGDLGEDDAGLNDRAVMEGGRILSAYVLTTRVRFLIITEADRSATTFLLPEDY